MAAQAWQPKHGAHKNPRLYEAIAGFPVPLCFPGYTSIGNGLRQAIAETPLRLR